MMDDPFRALSELVDRADVRIVREPDEGIGIVTRLTGMRRTDGTRFEVSRGTSRLELQAGGPDALRLDLEHLVLQAREALGG